jgi:hypothetical protein
MLALRKHSAYHYFVSKSFPSFRTGRRTRLHEKWMFHPQAQRRWASSVLDSTERSVLNHWQPVSIKPLLYTSIWTYYQNLSATANIYLLLRIVKVWCMKLVIWFGMGSTRSQLAYKKHQDFIEIVKESLSFYPLYTFLWLDILTRLWLL